MVGSDTKVFEFVKLIATKRFLAPSPPSLPSFEKQNRSNSPSPKTESIPSRRRALALDDVSDLCRSSPPPPCAFAASHAAAIPYAPLLHQIHPLAESAPVLICECVDREQSQSPDSFARAVLFEVPPTKTSAQRGPFLIRSQTLGTPRASSLLAEPETVVACRGALNPVLSSVHKLFIVRSLSLENYWLQVKKKDLL